MEFCSISRDEYISFQRQHPHADFLNDIETMDLSIAQGSECLLAGVKEDGKILAAVMLRAIPLVRGMMKCYYVPRGFLVDYEDENLFSFFVEGLKQFVKKHKGTYVHVDPKFLVRERDMDGNIVEGGFDNRYLVERFEKYGFEHQGYQIGYGHTMQLYRFVYTMDLRNRTKESLWKNLHQQTRWSINRTLKYHMQVRELSMDELDIYMDIMEKTGQRRNFHAKSLDLYKAQMESYGEHIRFMLAYVDVNIYRASLQEQMKINENELAVVDAELEKVPNSKKFNKKKKVVLEAIDTVNKWLKEADELEAQYGTIIPMAASEFILYGNEIIYMFSGAYEEFRSFYASYALQWHMITYALEHGYEKYNFLGITGNFDPESEDYGVYQFKRGFPGTVEELAGDFILPVDKLKYTIYKKLKG